MQDLSANMFYKAKFTITANDQSVDLLWTLILEIRNWLLTKWNKDGHKIVKTDSRVWTKFKFGWRIFDEEKTNHIYGESAYHESKKTGSVSWACKIVEKRDPIEGYAQREWTTEIGFQASDNNSAIISYVVTYNDMPGYIGFCEEPPSISVPRVIRSLLSHEKITCSIGPTRLSNDPIWLNPGDYPAFEEALFNSDRELPIIYISPHRLTLESDFDDADESERGEMLVNPCKMAKSVAANALVFCSNQLEFTDEMRWFIDSRYGCAGGAIRVYRPKINVDDPNDHFKHRFISSSFIQEHGEEAVLNIFRRALAQDVHFYESMFRLDNCQDLIDDEIQEKRIQALREKSETEIDEAYQEYLDESDRRKEAERKIRSLQENLDREKSNNHNLSIQIEALRGKADQAREIEFASKRVREVSVYPSTPQEIARYFEIVYPERIVFTERAYRSMDDCITKSDFLWEVFYHIAVDLYDLLHICPAKAYKEFTDKTGWECSRGMGTMTRLDRKLMRKYIDSFDGQEINIEAHIKNGNKDSDPKSVRIYFAYDPQITDRIIIGHCGKHLDNYSSRKIK